MEPTKGLRQAVKEYKEGKAEAFTTLYDESSKYVYTCIYKVMSGNDNAQDIINDIMQDTYVEISKYITQLEDEGKFLSWAGTIATRKCYAYLKKNKKYVLLNEEDNTFENLSDSDSIIPEEVLQDREKQRLVREIIETQLTEMQKLCIIAYYYNEKKQSEIAEELGIPENTVKTNLSRAKAKIKDGVLDLEKREGTKLYSVAPFLLLLFKEEVQAAVIPKEVTESIMSAVSDLAGAGVGAASKGIIGKITSASLKTKIIAGVVAVGVLGGVAGTVYVVGQQQEEVVAKNENVEEYSDQVAGLQSNVETEVFDTDAEELSSEQTVSKEESEESVFEEGTWQFILYNKLLTQQPQDALGNERGFDLHDFDGDGVPELIIGYTNTNYTGLDIFCVSGEELENRSIMNMFFYSQNAGYGSEPSQIISFTQSTDEAGRDTSSYCLYDNYEIVEAVYSSPSINGENPPYNVQIESSIKSISYEEGQAKVQQIREGYQKIEFKPINEQTIIETIEGYIAN